MKAKCMIADYELNKKSVELEVEFKNEDGTSAQVNTKSLCEIP